MTYHGNEMKFLSKFCSVIFFNFCFVAISFAQQNITYSCNFTNIVATRWINGEWVNSKFLPRTNQFLIKIENDNVDVRSIAEHLGGWGGMDVTCSYIDSMDNESKHYRCMQKSVSSKLFVFNPTSKNGALVSPDGAWFPDNWKSKDDVGIEFFKCR